MEIDEFRFIDSGVEEVENQALIDLLKNKVYFIDNGLDDIIELLNTQENKIIKLETQLQIIIDAWSKCNKDCPIDLDMLNFDRVAMVYPDKFVDKIVKLEKIYAKNKKQWFDDDDL